MGWAKGANISAAGAIPNKTPTAGAARAVTAVGRASLIHNGKVAATNAIR